MSQVSTVSVTRKPRQPRPLHGRVPAPDHPGNHVRTTSLQGCAAPALSPAPLPCRAPSDHDRKPAVAAGCSHRSRRGCVAVHHPAGWPPFQVFTWESLRRYGFVAEAQACEAAWLRGALRLYDQTGKIYEKYNVVDGTLILPKERQDSIPPLHGWSTASCLLAGLALFGRQSA